MSGPVETGDKVSWKWGSGNPSGTAAEVEPSKVTITTKKGNEVSKNGDESNPAVHIERSGNDVVKKASELTVESKGSGSESNKQNGTSKDKDDEKTDEKTDEKEKPSKAKDDKSEEKKEATPAATNGKEAHAGEKRKADKKVDAAAEKKQENGDDKKKQKTDTNGTAAAAPTNGTTEKKKPGRPKGQGGAAKKEKKEPVVGKAQRKTRSQGAA